LTQRRSYGILALSLYRNIAASRFRVFRESSKGNHVSAHHTTRVIAIGNQKGGVGKTTNTVQLAAALGQLGRRCLIWDLDMNYGATRHFGIPPEAFLGSFEVLMGDEDAANVIIDENEADVQLPPNVHIIPSSRKLEKIDQALSEKNKFAPRQFVLKKPLEQIRSRYDYILLDTAPNATTPTIAAYASADWFLLSAMPDPFAVGGLNDALLDIESARQYGNPNLAILGVVLSGVDRRTRLATMLTEYVEKTFTIENGFSLKFETEISRSTVIPDAQKEGKTLFQTEPAHKVTEQYRQLALEVEERFVKLAGGSGSAPTAPEAGGSLVNAAAPDGSTAEAG